MSVSRLYTDLWVSRTILAEISYSWGKVDYILRISSSPYVSERNSVIGEQEYIPLLADGLSTVNISASAAGGETYGGVIEAGFSSISFINNGDYDDAESWVIDGRTIRLLTVGTLADGTVITYNQASASPLFSGTGIDRPERGLREVICKVRAGDASFAAVMNQQPFSPQCLEFPGSVGANVEFADPVGLSPISSFTWYGWVHSYNSTLINQTIVAKDDGVSGISVTLSAGEVTFTCRGQLPESTATTGGGFTVLGNVDTHIAVVWNSATSTRKIIVNGVDAASTTGITGALTGNTSSLIIGDGFEGRLSWWHEAGSALLASQIRDEMFRRYPLNFTARWLLDEGLGNETLETSGSLATYSPGVISGGIFWAASTWCGSSLVGRRWPIVIGQALRLPLAPVDPPLSRLATSYPPPCAPPVALYSSHNPLTSGQYSFNAGSGLVTLISAPLGQYMGDIPGESIFNGALYFDGINGMGSATPTCPSGSMWLHCMVRPDTFDTSARFLVGWRNGAAGDRFFKFESFGNNSIIWAVRNDAGVIFFAYDSIPARMWSVIDGVLDTTEMEIRIYINGGPEPAMTVEVSGTFNTTHTTFGVAREPSAAQWFYPGRIDEVLVANYVMPVTEGELRYSIEQAMVRSMDVNTDTIPPPEDPQLVHVWHMDEASGSTVFDNGTDTDNITLTGGFAWVQGRIAAADCVRVAMDRYRTTAAPLDLDFTSSATHIRATRSADCQLVVDDERTIGEVLDAFLRGCHSQLIPITNGVWLLKQVSFPIGTPDSGADFDRSHIVKDSDLISARSSLKPPAYEVQVLYGQNLSPMSGDQLAGILETEPDLYRFGVSQWRIAPARDGDVIIDYPAAGVVKVESPFLDYADAVLEAKRVLPLYGPDAEGLLMEFVFAASPFIQLLGELRLTFEEGSPSIVRHDCSPPGRCFRIISVVRQGSSVSVIGLAEAVRTRITAAGDLRVTTTGGRRRVR